MKRPFYLLRSYYLLLGILTTLTAEGQWTVSSLPQAKGYVSGVGFRKRALFVSGNTIDLYNDSTGTWKTMSHDLSNCLSTIGCGNYFLFGKGNMSGSDHIDGIDVYNATNGSWNPYTLPHPRGPVAVTTVGNKVFYAGGWDGIGNLTNIIDVLDVSSFKWSTIYALDAAAYIDAVSVGSKIMFVAKTTASVLNDVYIFDTATSGWSKKYFPKSVSSSKSVSAGGKVFFIGDSNNLYTYDPVSDVWTTKNFTNVTQLASVGSRIFLSSVSAGGDIAIDVYDVNTDGWTSLMLPTKRTGFSEVTTDSKVIFSGGLDESLVASKTVDLYDANPHITSISPGGAVVGTPVVISGYNFSTIPSNNTLVFNGVSATINSSTTTSMQVNVPSGATTGNVILNVKDGLTASSSYYFKVVGPEPTFQPTGLKFNSYSSSSISAGFTAASGATGYIVIRKKGSTPTVPPEDGTVYTIGSSIGDGIVVSFGNSVVFDDTNLDPNSIYFYDVMSYSGSGEFINYRTVSALEGSHTTFASQPGAQPKTLSFSGFTTNALTGNFIAAQPNPSGYLILARQGASPTGSPIDGVVYTIGASIGDGIVVAAGNKTTFSFTSLTPNTNYYFDIFSYNGAANATRYLTASPLEGNRRTLSPEPTTRPSSLTFDSFTSNSFRGLITPSTLKPDGYLVLRKQGSLPTEIPIDGTSYTAETDFGASRIVYVGNFASFENSGIAFETTYYFAVYPYNGSASSANFLTNTPLTNSVISLPPPPVALEAINPVTDAFKAKWVAVNSAVSYELDVSLSPTFDSFAGNYNKVTTALEETVSSLLSNKPYYYRVRARNLSGLSDNSNTISVTTVKDNSVPLSIASQKITSNGDSLRFSIELSGGVGPKVVNVKWRGILSQGEFVETILNPISKTYEASITASSLDAQGLEYYFTASDATIDVPIQSSSFYTYTPISQVIPNLSSGGTPENYRIISIPVALDNSDPTAVFNSPYNQFGGYDISQWRLQHYEPGDPHGKNIDFDGIVKIETGKGYWFNSRQPVDITVSGTATNANQSNPFKLELQKGWNQIGNPYTFNVLWSDVLTQNNNPADAGSKFYAYDADNVSFKESSVINAWSGGFVKATAPIILEIPVTVKQTSNGRIASNSEIENHDISQPEWFLPLKLIQGNAYNTMGGIGMHPDASLSNDRYDEQSLPRFEHYLELNSYHPEFFLKRFTRDVVPPKSEYRWEFTLESNFEKSESTLQWDNSALGSNDAQLRLFDADAGVIVDMKKVDHYSFILKDTRHVTLYYSQNGDNFTPEWSGIGKVYPNPFIDEITIPYYVGPKSQNVQLEIFDLTGWRINGLVNGRRDAGVYQVTWDGVDERKNRVASGIYVYKFSVEGKTIAVNKMILK